MMTSGYLAWVTGRRALLLTDAEAVGRAGLGGKNRNSMWDVVNCLSVI